MVKFVINASFSVSPDKIFSAWLSSEGHSKMTGGAATCSDKQGDKFMAWDGYISGYNKHLERNKRIIQCWRTADFKDSDNDSEITIELEPTTEGCMFTLTHQHIPDGQPDYEKGWEDHYIKPMRTYFN